MTASYTYDNQGALTSMGYTLPVYPGGAQVFTYTLDAMERPTGMTDNMNLTYASGAAYNAANQPLNDGTGTRTYNNLLQVTSMTGLGMNMTPITSRRRRRGGYFRPGKRGSTPGRVGRLGPERSFRAAGRGRER